MIQSILLATDGSASAERAADFAASLATRHGAKVTVLHAFTPVSSYLGEPNYSRKLYKTLDEAKSLVVHVAKRLRAHDLTTGSLIREGRPVKVILEKAGVLSADLIVIGACGRTRSGPFRMGDVAQKVVKYDRCSVLVVR